MNHAKATLLGTGAIGMWAFLALLTVATAPVPPFLLSALCFAIGGTIGLVPLLASGEWRKLLAGGWKATVFGTAGLFGYHALYFWALRLAPPAEAGLIAYLWPLLIVLLSGLLPGIELRRGHVLGALAGFAGAALIVSNRLEGFAPGALPGFGLAFLCALAWAGYSVFSRWLGAVPTASVALFCLASALLAAVAHLLFETTLWPQGTAGWLAVLALGAGPVGLAFYLWDIGMKHGNIQFLGVASYAAPLLSTLLLVLARIAQTDWRIAVAAGLIAGGAWLAACTGKDRA